ncbi:hypothetical protein EG68_04994 [Paragonimus skrjabini miyazakii]|uniref:Uncharacterized protein n=1 Tax=Paragonimus skrjabini miyazakii TaxID=59628 RepID=A0A8S9YS46_9TREM|nr:hypothetical protein EG68_04994 [Paragonimus skrjabini miyazakii]
MKSTTRLCHEALLTCNTVPQPWSSQLVEFTIHLYLSSKCVKLRCPTLSKNESVQRLLKEINRRLNPYEDIPGYISSLAFMGMRNVTLQSALLYATLNSNWTQEALRDKNSDIFKRTKTLLQHELQKLILFQRLQNHIIQMDIKNIGLTQTSSATAYIRLFIRATNPKFMNPTFLNRNFRELTNFMEHTQFIALRKLDMQNNYYILELRIEHKELSDQKRNQLEDKDSRLYQIMLHRSTVQTNAAIQACKWGNMIQNMTVQLQGTNNSSESISQTALLVMSVDRVNPYRSNLNINHLVNCIIDGFEQEQYSRIIRNIDIKGNMDKTVLSK